MQQKTVSIDLIAENVRAGTLVKQGRKEHTIINEKRLYIQWQEVSCLEHEEDWKKRKIKEALFINAMDSKEIMNLEKGFEINPCWNEFNPHIRTIAQKKGKS